MAEVVEERAMAREDFNYLLDQMNQSDREIRQTLGAVQVEIGNRLTAMQTDISHRLDTMQAGISRRFDSLQTEMNSRFDTLHGEMWTLHKWATGLVAGIVVSVGVALIGMFVK